MNRINPPRLSFQNILYIFLFVGAGILQSCSSTPTQETAEESETVQTDPYFQGQPPVESGELYRILINDDGYHYQQLGKENLISRKPDEAGDEEAHSMLMNFGKKYNFKDWEFEGLLSVRLNATSGDIEHIEYVPGNNPKSWQVSRLFQEDISRFHFEFSGDFVNPRNFLVRYRWNISREAGLSDEEAKKRALEFLKSQVR